MPDCRHSSEPEFLSFEFPKIAEHAPNLNRSNDTILCLQFKKNYLGKSGSACGTLVPEFSHCLPQGR